MLLPDLSIISRGSRYKVLCSVSQPQKSGKFLGVWVVLSRAQKGRFVGHYGRNTKMLDQELENLCARTDFCVFITIGPSSTCRIAKFETRALYFTYNSTINESIRMLSIKLLHRASFGKILPWFFLSSALYGSRYKNQYCIFIAKKR